MKIKKNKIDLVLCGDNIDKMPDEFKAMDTSSIAMQIAEHMKERLSNVGKIIPYWDLYIAYISYRIPEMRIHDCGLQRHIISEMAFLSIPLELDIMVKSIDQKYKRGLTTHCIYFDDFNRVNEYQSILENITYNDFNSKSFINTGFTMYQIDKLVIGEDLLSRENKQLIDCIFGKDNMTVEFNYPPKKGRKLVYEKDDNTTRNKNSIQHEPQSIYHQLILHDKSSMNRNMRVYECS